MESTKAEANKGKKSHLKLILNIALFVILTGLALFYVLKDDPAKSFSLISTINLLPFLIALVIVALINLLDGITITSFAKIYNPHYRYSQGVVTALIGSFMGVFNKASSNLVQAYTLSKQDIKASHSASILTMNFLMYQLTLTVYSLIMVLVGYNSVKDIPLDLLGDMPIFYISLIGFSVDVIFLLIILFVGFSKTFHRFIINIGVSAIKILHIKKDPELLRKEWVVKITTYRVEFRRLFNHLGTDTIAFFIGLIKQFLLNSLPFFAIWCLTDVSSINFISCISGASYLNLITTFIPTGAPEVCFQAIYGYILQNQAL
ncbi:MAG: hypothetical protein WCR67_03245, partial [Bacilli bacterium]